MRKKLSYRFAATTALAASLLTLTLPADAQPVRVRLTIELDPALQMGPRVETIIPVRRTGPQRRYVAAGGNFSRTLGAVYWRRPYFYWSDGTYDGPTILGVASTIEDAPVATPVRPAPPTDLEIRRDALDAGDYRTVIERLADRDPADLADDELAALVVAYEGAGRTGEAARVFLESLGRTPDAELAAQMALPRDELLPGARETRRARRLLADYLEDTNDPAAHVLLATYLWAGPRPETALTALDDALAAGLDPALHARLTSALASELPEPPAPRPRR